MKKASFIVDGHTVKSYNYSGNFSKVLQRRWVDVSYTFPRRETNFPTLFIFFLDILSAEIFVECVFAHNVNKLVRVRVPKHFGQNVEMFVTISFDRPRCPIFANLATYYYNDNKSKAIRDKPQDFINNIETVEEIFYFVEAFLKTGAGTSMDAEEVLPNVYFEHLLVRNLDFGRIRHFCVKLAESLYYSNYGIRSCYEPLRDSHIYKDRTGEFPHCAVMLKFMKIYLKAFVN